MSDGGQQHKPGVKPAHQAPKAGEQQAFVPSSETADRSWPLTDPMRGVRAERASAQNQIARSLKAWRLAKSGAEQQHGGGVEVSQPHEAAEVEADSIADRVADSLHGEADKAGSKDAAAGPAQAAPPVAAKLDPNKIHRAGDKPVRGAQKDKLGTGPEANMVHVGNAVQAGVTRPPQHHVLPQEERAWFKAHGVNVDEYCVNVDQAHHEALHKMGWNEQIMTALRDAEKAKKGKKLTLAEILATARAVMATFKIDKLPFVKYGSERPEAK